MKKVVLARNLPKDDGEADEGNIPKPVSYDESLVISICLNSSKMVWGQNTSEYFIYDKTPKDPSKKAKRELVLKYTTVKRERKLIEKMVLNNAWMKDKSQEEVQSINEAFKKWMDEGVVPDVASRTTTE
jgi:paired amphipathic helix protein Sin3a